MKPVTLCTALILLAAAVMAAETKPVDEVKAAAKRLTDTNNYSWKTSVSWGGQAGGSVDGKTEKAGATILSMSFGNMDTEVVLKENKVALKRDAGWKSLAEAAGEGDPGRRFTRMFERFKTPGPEAEDLAGKAKELKSADGIISGDLTEAGAKDLMQFGRRSGETGPEVTGAKGSVKFWIKDGQLSKYEYHLEGKMSFDGNDRDVDWTSTVEIKDVGATKVTVPEEAAKKLS